VGARKPAACTQIVPPRVAHLLVEIDPSARCFRLTDPAECV